MRRAFSLLELLIVIALLGVMAIFSSNYIDITSISKSNIKTEFKSHFNIISSAILYCKELSNVMPIQNGGSPANATLLTVLECNTSTPYLLDGGKGSFIPPPVTGATAYTATQTGSEFYFSTTAVLDSRNDEVLQELESDYSTNQFELTHDATTAYLKFYLSR